MLEFTYLEVLQVYKDQENVWYSQTDEFIEPLGTVSESEMMAGCRNNDWKFAGVVGIKDSSGFVRPTWVFVREFLTS